MGNCVIHVCSETLARRIWQEEVGNFSDVFKTAFTSLWAIDADERCPPKCQSLRPWVESARFSRFLWWAGDEDTLKMHETLRVSWPTFDNSSQVSSVDHPCDNLSKVLWCISLLSPECQGGFLRLSFKQTDFSSVPLSRIWNGAF